ncbi:ABC transporter substrate-binding protein [Salinisphaera sp. USBA-960]|uniref:MlaC/ttg2D family ABC transporter substrate-binding protein n=1 Tax=Salinisphaera orenii TaxID=856731 RepID=UPI0013A6044B|nr:ABC transporter substrate-binding protein [Salifodinibacter halophilus]NNC26925.1 ABC transporter substrate-binding protein [Salifodinibacter halophilus]
MQPLKMLVAAFVAGAVMAPAAMSADASSKTPEQLAKQTVEKVLDDMDGRREQLRNNPQQLKQLIEKDLVPVLDQRYMAQLTLGRYWRQASAEQRKAFQRTFRNLLIQNYGDALLKLKSGENLDYKPVRAPADADKVTFNAIYHTPKGRDIHLSLKLRQVDGQWKVYDASGENLSFVANYKEQFRSRIQKVGLDKFIQQMKSRYGTHE